MTTATRRHPLRGRRISASTTASSPPLAPGFVRVRFAAGGICGSDMHYF